MYYCYYFKIRLICYRGAGLDKSSFTTEDFYSLEKVQKTAAEQNKKYQSVNIFFWVDMAHKQCSKRVTDKISLTIRSEETTYSS